MREIKFRIFDKNIPKDLEETENNTPSGMMVNWDYVKQSSYLMDGINRRYPIMQYTGLKDKNGKEIYEGDIVSTDLSRPFLIVEFRNGAFVYQCHDNGQDYYDHMEPAFSESVELTKYHKIIGNIYENPELLKGDGENE